MPHHEYTIETQAKFAALNELIEHQANRIAELESELKAAWDEYGRANSLSFALNN